MSAVDVLLEWWLDDFQSGGRKIEVKVEIYDAMDHEYIGPPFYCW
jgi:hypothetical protein